VDNIIQSAGKCLKTTVDGHGKQHTDEETIGQNFENRFSSNEGVNIIQKPFSMKDVAFKVRKIMP
jgi:hypothetical protein